MSYRDELKDQLIRTVLTGELIEKVGVLAAAKPDALLKIIIDVNQQYPDGREAAFQAVAEAAVAALAGQTPAEGVLLPVSIGSATNPYMRAVMTPGLIQAMIEIDGRRQYSAIYRIWEDFQVQALIDRSVSTVKADAARRAFLADGKDIVWAVLDSGIDATHVHFADYQNTLLSAPVRHFDFTVLNGDGAASALVDEFGHGTHVAGIIAGGYTQPRLVQAVRSRLDSSGKVVPDTVSLDQVCGMAPRCRLVSMKVLNKTGNGDASAVIEAIDAIQQINDHGRRLLIHGANLSLGYEFQPQWFACGQSPVCVEVDRLVRSGVVVVVAAGNTGYGTQSAAQRATRTGLVMTINDPGNSELAITVGSTHRDMPHIYGVSFFSSKGPTGDGRLKPDLVAPGERILSCLSTKGVAGQANNSYLEDSGTSMAAPHVSGVIASFLSIRREYIGQAEEVKRVFMDSATDLKRDRYFQGRGLVDAMRALQSV